MDGACDLNKPSIYSTQVFSELESISELLDNLQLKMNLATKYVHWILEYYIVQRRINSQSVTNEQVSISSPNVRLIHLTPRA
jgi:hypothetical protein